ncbi:hypothetical protein [Roseateles sp.]|uniref:hypothetical protein n=1 Tax=Roseateles sp. TaxID=1971397 RepID=UPI002E05DF5E|nr:hypothetical protein [Roseateles sp.]
MNAPQPPERGQAAVEYLVVAAGLILALFVVEFGGRTGAQYLAEAVRLFFQNLTYYLSLP